MHKILLAIALAAAIGLVACNGDKSKTDASKHAEHGESMEHSAKKVAEHVVYYTCPMEEHSHVALKEQGKCDECGMDMVAAVKITEGEHDFYGCPMAEHSHIRSDKPGTCAECGMTYQPMKLNI